MHMTTIHTQTEQKRQDSSARRAEERRRRARTRRLRGFMVRVPAACATADAGHGQKRLSSGRVPATFTSNSMLLGECRVMSSIFGFFNGGRLCEKEGPLPVPKMGCGRVYRLPVMAVAPIAL